MRRLLLHFAAVTALGACLLAGGSSATVTPIGKTQVISRATGTGTIPPGTFNYSYSMQQSVSEDGRYVAFASTADSFSTQDDNRYQNIFVRDRTTNTTILVSRASGAGGAAANAGSGSPVISSDGTHVAFLSTATNLDPAVTTAGPNQLYVRNLTDNTTKLVSRATTASGAPANAESAQASLSRDGTKIAFWSHATNLASLGTAYAQQVYVRDLSTDTTTLVSRATVTGDIGNAYAYSPSISGDGTAVAFYSNSSNFGDGDANMTFDVHLRRLAADTTELISQSSTNVPGNATSSFPAVNYDGTKIAFATDATNFDTTADTNAARDVYLRDTTAGTTTLISRATTAAGAIGNAASQDATISGDGKVIAFTSAATNLVAGAAPTEYDNHVFVRDLTGVDPSTDVANRANGASGAIGDLGAFAPSISRDGTKVVFDSYSTNLTTPPGDADFEVVLLRDRTGAATSLVSRPDGTGPIDRQTAWSWMQDGAVSSDGRYVGFTSDSDNLSSEDDNRWWNVYRRDTLADTTVLVSRASGASGAAGNRYSGNATISSDGSRIAFQSTASNLVPGDTNGVSDCFVRDLNSNTTLLVSRTSAGGLLTQSSGSCYISRNGNRVVFVTRQALDPADPGSNSDVYVRDLTTNETLLASRYNGPAGPAADAFIGEPVLNADGTKVAYGSSAPLSPEAASHFQVYLRDLAAGTTKLVSRATGASGAPGDSDSLYLSIDAAGRHVAFTSTATNLITAPVNTSRNVFVRDLVANTTTLASRADSASGAIGNTESYSPALSDDGSVVAFYSAADNLVPGDTNHYEDVFVRNLATNTTTAVSRGTNGLLGNGFSVSPALSGNGHCVAFRSNADNMDPAVGRSDFSFDYMRTIAGECPNDPPDTTITGSPPAKTRSRSATITSSSNDSTATFQCALDGAAFAACGPSYSIQGLADGTHTAQVRAVDPAGNLDATPASVTWSVDATPPKLTIVIPKQRLKKVLARGLRLRLRATEKATATARLRLKRRVVGSLARKSIGTKPRTFTIRIRLSKKALRALRHARSVRLVLVVAARDTLGNPRTVRRTVKIRR